MRNILKWIGILVLVLVLLFIFYPNFFFRIPEPVRSSTLSLPALIEPVTVIYDEHALPHVYAGNEHDLFYAAGYIMAAERLFQMDMTNRAVQGRLAEMNAGLVNADKYLRTWGFHHIGKQIAETMDPNTRRIVQWGCDGINAYIDSHRENLPLEFKLTGHQPLYWDPAIVCGFDRLMAEDLNTAWGRELAITRLLESFGDEDSRDLFPARPTGFIPPFIASPGSLLEEVSSVGEELGVILCSGTGLRASNNWVVSGSRSTTGGPFLANDMHLGYSQPPVWYEMHLVGGRFNVRGLCFPGVPIVVVGHNEHIAWGFTNLMTDDTDFYLEQVNPEDSTNYLHRGKWVPFNEREEVIQVKDGDPVTFTVRETVHGIIIHDISDIASRSDQLIAMRWTGQDITDDITPFLKLNLARNWDDFTAAARGYATPGQNVVYADREGNIGWRPFVRIPIRRGAEYLTVLPGASGEYDWQGYVPLEEMPFLYNPPSGYIATANNDIVGNDFPYYVTAYWALPYRVQRISELLADSREHDLESLMAIQNEALSVQARELVPILVAACEDSAGRQDLEPLVAKSLDLLIKWDYVMDTESAAATIFTAWFEHLKEAIYKDEMDKAGEEIYAHYLRTGFATKSIAYLLLKEASPWFDNVNTPDVEDRDTVIRWALAAAVEELRGKLGKRVRTWTWGRIHTLTHPHALAGGGRLGKFLDWWLDLNVGPFPVPGSGSTVNAINYRTRKPYVSNWGPSERSIIDLSNLDNSRMILPTGQSGHPFSRHYRDQAELYNTGQYRTVDFSREAVERNAHCTLVLQP